MIGCPIARDDVIPAKKRSPNHIAPAIGANQPQLLKSVGSVRKPSEKPLPPAVALCTAERPRYAVAIGMRSDPPRMTSTNSFIHPALAAFSATSSFFFT